MTLDIEDTDFSTSYEDIDNPLTGILYKAPHDDRGPYLQYNISYVFYRGIEMDFSAEPNVALGGYTTVFHLWKIPLESVLVGLKPQIDDRIRVNGVLYTITKVETQSRGYRYRCNCVQNVDQG